MNRKPIVDTQTQEHLSTLAPDVRDVFLLQNETVRGTVINGTEMVNQMRVNHELGILETYTLGQAYLAGAVLASTVKGDDRVQLTIECGGPIKGLSVEAWASGGVRGYLQENPIEITSPLESFDLFRFLRTRLPHRDKTARREEAALQLPGDDRVRLDCEGSRELLREERTDSDTHHHQYPVR